MKIKIIFVISALMILGILAGFQSTDAPAGVETSSLSLENDPALKAGLLPHRALYDIKLAGSKNGSQILNVAGQMFYEWRPSCEAWISNHRFKLRYEYADTPAMDITSEFSTYESLDGKSLSFTSQRKRNGEIYEELRGQADIDKEEKGLAVYSIPDGLSYDLPKGAMFPMSHTLAVLDNIRAGKKFFSAVIFDGSDEEGPVEINTFIGKAHLMPAVNDLLTPMNEILQASPAWNVRLAFFPLTKPEATSDYEMSIVLHENGVISDMKIDYHDFSVSQKLTALDKMEQNCDNDIDNEKNPGFETPQKDKPPH